MIVLAGTAQARPEFLEEAVKQALIVMEAASADADCSRFLISQHLTDPTTFYFFGEWESEEAFIRYLDAPYNQEFNASLAVTLAGDLHIKRYHVSAAEEL